MNAQRFCDWLNGYVELGGSLPNNFQWDMIKSHLALVFDKVTPPLTTLTSRIGVDGSAITTERTGWHDKLPETVKTPQQEARESAEKAVKEQIEKMNKQITDQIRPSIINPSWPYQLDQGSPLMPYPTQLVAKC